MPIVLIQAENLYFSGCPDKKTYVLINHLRELILQDGYTCAVLTVNGESDISRCRFSLATSPTTPETSLRLVTGFCRPDLILLDDLDLKKLADVLVMKEDFYYQIQSDTALVLEFGSITPKSLWMAVQYRFDPLKGTLP